MHPPGTLGSSPVITPTVRRFTGRIIEDNRTEDHPDGGSASTMTKATHWLEFASIPILIAPNSSRSRPVTQAAILLENEEPGADEFLYSIRAKRGRAEAAATPEELRMATVPEELLPFFTPRSIDDERLIFAPREHVRETARVNVYEGTPIPERFIRNLDRTKSQRGLMLVAHERNVRRRVELAVTREMPERPLSSYIFKSSFRVRTNDQDID